MAFNFTNFTSGSFLSYWTPVDRQEVSREWLYSTSENLVDITSHYFNEVGNRIRKGDFIKVTADDGVGLFYVFNATFNDTYPLENSSTVIQMV